tara:strand:+ start:170 stop:706 length:537 start_codon:yes stop_codon:yes gene_type:complete
MAKETVEKTTKEDQTADGDLIIDRIVKIVVLRENAQLICGLQIMESGEGDDKKTIGYYLHSPCILSTSKTDEGNLDATMYPWIPGSKDRIVPIAANQVATIVDPIDQLVEMYVKNILEPTMRKMEENVSDPVYGMSNAVQDSSNGGPPIYQPNTVKNSEVFNGQDNQDSSTDESADSD